MIAALKFIAVLCLLSGLSGCVYVTLPATAGSPETTRRMSLAEFRKTIRQSVQAPVVVTEEIIEGCFYFLAAQGRWPANKEEIASALRAAGRKSTGIQTVQNLDLKREAGAVLYTFSTTAGNSGEIRINLGRQNPDIDP